MNIIHEGIYHLIVANWNNSEERELGKNAMVQKGYEIYNEFLDKENMKVNVILLKKINE